MDKATKRPWKWGWNGNTCAVWGAAIVIGGIGDSQAEDRKIVEANAALIVEAVNAYDGLVSDRARLVETLRAMVKAFKPSTIDPDDEERYTPEGLKALFMSQQLLAELEAKR